MNEFVKLGPYVFEKHPRSYIIDVERGNDYGEPSYKTSIHCNTMQELIHQLNHMNYYDTILGVHENIAYEIDWDATRNEYEKEDEDDESLF